MTEKELKKEKKELINKRLTQKIFFENFLREHETFFNKYFKNGIKSFLGTDIMIAGFTFKDQLFQIEIKVNFNNVETEQIIFKTFSKSGRYGITESTKIIVVKSLVFLPKEDKLRIVKCFLNRYKNDKRSNT